MVGWEFWLQTFVAAGLGTAAVETIVSYVRYRSRKSDLAGYTALRIAVALERFASDCLELIGKNKYAPQHPDEEYPNWDIGLPLIVEYPSDEEGWRALDRSLASRALSLQNQQIWSQRKINDSVEFDEDRLDLAVAEEASSLGFEAAVLAYVLRGR